MPTNHTTNYNLSQWELTDKVQMEDFNADNAKIDAALAAQAATLARHAAELDKKGNCTIGVFSYTGTGKYGADNPTRITFPKMPLAYFVVGDDLMAGKGGTKFALHTYSVPGGCAVASTTVSWSGNTLSLYDLSYADRQMNSGATEYQVIGFYVP